ncbi:hypothetical protein RQM47_05450 [Rubrivirga sp. S365]|uniref:Oxidoreductase n=1 Tax=Rubrivirga litoralis TaxID=3075598 RepID=A0ABU3BR33_9BACT|nr:MULTISPECIES: hypothetical protein [unclassified Rubrivirga]MDT0631756.1 hypothetical protein [Rubrivirga sp. F394]MDT7856079.1 hypothetical protein [Rubrivirga sp. S365]
MTYAAPPLSVLGDDDLADRLDRAGLPIAGAPSAGGVAVVGGAVGQRAAAAGRVAAAGAHPFALWPPGVSAADADALAARAEEAGVEVGVARPALARGAAGLGGWTAGLVSLSLAAPPDGALGAGGALGGALDLVLALVGRGAVGRLDAAAERDGARLRALAASLRFRSGAFAQVWLRADEDAGGLATSLHASRPGSHIDATRLDRPLVVSGQPAPPAAPDADPLVAEVAAFVRAVGAGRRPAYGLDAALATLRLVERVQGHLR